VKGRKATIRATKSQNRAARRQSPEWRKLRNDVPTFVASVCVYLASVCVIVALLGLVAPNTGFPMGQPLFWVLAVPLTFWAVALGSYGPVSVAIFRGLMIADVPAILFILGLAFAKGAGGIELFVGAAGFTLVLVGVAALFYTKSALRVQGPSR
jgi:hypothetical protein